MEQIASEPVAVTCVNCGCALDEKTGRLAAPEWYGDTRFVHYCLKCQREQFLDFARQTRTRYVPFYLCCAAYNLPFLPECVPEAGRTLDGYDWQAYLYNLDQTAHAVHADGEPACFADGINDLHALFGIDRRGELNRAVTLPDPTEGKQGTRAQRRNWGELDPYTTADYKELDRLYEIQCRPFQASGIDPEMEYNIREVCKLLLLYNKQRGRGEVKEAKLTYDIVSKFKADNLMRKRDETAEAAQKLDTLVDALERAGYAQNGKLLPYDQLLDKLRGDHPVYDMGHDIVDQIILSVYNTIRRNEGLGETDLMPLSLQIDPQCGEFRPDCSPAERQLMAAMEILPQIRKEAPPCQKAADGTPSCTNGNGQH